MIGTTSRKSWSQSGREGTTFRKRSEEHTSELQPRLHLVCRLPLEKKNKASPPTSSADRRDEYYSGRSLLCRVLSDWLRIPQPYACAISRPWFDRQPWA